MSEQRLAAIEQAQTRTIVLLEGLTQKFDEKLEDVDEHRARVNKTLYGDNGQKGLMVRIDRLEQAGASVRWLVRTAVGAVVVSVVVALAALLT